LFQLLHSVKISITISMQWPIKEVEIDLLNKPSWFLDISPHGKVPVIVFKEAGKTQVAAGENTRAFRERVQASTSSPNG